MISWHDIENHIEIASQHAHESSEFDDREEAVTRALLAQAHAAVASAALAWRAAAT